MDETVLLAMVLGGAGLAAGVLAGLLGIGGGLVIVPALTWLFVHQGAPLDLAVPMAVATSLASMLLTSASSITFHARRGAMDWSCVARLGPAVAAGALTGAWLAVQVSGPTLARMFAAVAGIIGIRMLLAATVPAANRNPAPRAWWAAGPVIGAISAMVGIGGGSFNVPYLVRNGYPPVRAIACAAACGWPIGLAGALGFVVQGWRPVDWPGSAGFVHLPGAAWIGVAGILGAPAGVWLAHRLAPDPLRRLFGAFLLLIALRMAWQ